MEIRKVSMPFINNNFMLYENIRCLFYRYKPTVFNWSNNIVVITTQLLYKTTNLRSSSLA